MHINLWSLHYKFTIRIKAREIKRLNTISSAVVVMKSVLICDHEISRVYGGVLLHLKLHRYQIHSTKYTTEWGILYPSTKMRCHENVFRNITSQDSCHPGLLISIYRKTFSISRTKSQSFNISCIFLQLSSLNPLKPGVKLRMKM